MTRNYKNSYNLYESYDHIVYDKKTNGVDKTMASIRESAENYIPVETKNISELDSVNTELELETRTFKEGTVDEFTINVAVIEGEEYRVPDSVLKQLKVFLVEKPDMTEFKVNKEGAGLKTSYTIIPL